VNNDGWTVRENVAANYIRACADAATSDRSFATFKKDPRYTPILEHVSVRNGALYLAEIKKDAEVFSEIEFLKGNDSLGSPQLCMYDEEVGYISPSTLRYIFVLTHLHSLFEFDAVGQWNITEIGGGYGGQCKLIHDFFGFKSYTLFDLEEANMLSAKYLDALGVPDTRQLSLDDIEDFQGADLLISNFALAELNADVQEQYLEQVVQHCKNGYVTYNQPRIRTAASAMRTDEIMEKLCQYHNVQQMPEGIDSGWNDVNSILWWKEEG
jgi:hypothetical protein